MSTWTGGNQGTPDAFTDTRCCAPLCTTRIPYRFVDYGLHMCQEHALHTWAVIQHHLNAGTITDDRPEPRTGGTFDGWVYYIRTGGRIKIGHSINIDRRLAQYPPDVELLYVREGTKKLERAEHNRFRPHLTDGREWFRDVPEVTEPIAAMADAHIGWQEFHDDRYWRRRPAPPNLPRHTHRSDKPA